MHIVFSRLPHLLILLLLLDSSSYDQIHRLCSIQYEWNGWIASSHNCRKKGKGENETSKKEVTRSRRLCLVFVWWCAGTMKKNTSAQQIHTATNFKRVDGNDERFCIRTTIGQNTKEQVGVEFSVFSIWESSRRDHLKRIGHLTRHL